MLSRSWRNKWRKKEGSEEDKRAVTTLRSVLCHYQRPWRNRPICPWNNVKNKQTRKRILSHRERERERERQRQRQRERERQRETERDRDRETERDRERQRQTDRHTDRQTEGDRDRETET